jgi:PPOX class probable F420-dependent enzyme
MSGRGMDERARRFLSAAERRTAHLATASHTGEPHVVPICFVLLGDILYLAIDEKPKRDTQPRGLRRMRNIAENPRVAVVADVYDDQDWQRLGFVLVRGAARVLDGGEEHGQAIVALRAKYVQYRTMALEERPVIAIDVDRVTTWGDLSVSF